jgi:hypothetical protein
MRKYSKFIVVGGALAALAVPSAAMAAQPTGATVQNPNAPAAWVGAAPPNASGGQSVDNTTTPRSRGAIVQNDLGHNRHWQACELADWFSSCVRDLGRS